MSDFEGVARVAGLILVVAGVAVAILAGLVLVSGRRPVWLQKRQSLKEPFVRVWAVCALLSGLAALAIGVPYVQGYPVHGAALLLQAAGFVLLLGAAVSWGFIISRSGYRTP